MLVSGCGGGGGSGDSPVPPASQPVAVTRFPVGNIVTQLVTRGGTFTGKHMDASSNPSTISVIYAPGPAGWVTRRQSITATSAVPAPSQFIVGFLMPADLFQVTGFTSNTSDNALLTQSKPLPAAADVGSRDNLFKGSLLIQNNGINTVDIGLTHNLSYDWSLDAVNNTTADLCLSLQESADFITNTTVDCFRIDAKGTVLAFKSILRVRAKSIDFQTVYE